MHPPHCNAAAGDAGSTVGPHLIGQRHSSHSSWAFGTPVFGPEKACPGDHRDRHTGEPSTIKVPALKFKFMSPMSDHSFTQRRGATSRSSTSASSFAFSFPSNIPSIPVTELGSFRSYAHEESESDDEGDSVANYGSRKPSRGRLAGACGHCKSLKVRCEFYPGETICQRCLSGKHECIVRGRKKRKPAPTHDDLQRRAQKQNVKIQALLQQFDSMKTDEKIRHWLEKSESDHTATTALPDSDMYDGVGLSPSPYLSTTEDGQLLMYLERRLQWSKPFPSGHSFVCRSESSESENIHEPIPPDIVKYGVVSPEEIEILFRIFFDRINIFFSLLDPELHTPSSLIWSCPFLFTVICALGSRFWKQRPSLYPLAMEFARDAAGKALINGSQTIDICQAYLLMAVYPVPGKNWYEDRSWILMGVAIRMAMELNLHQPPPESCSESEKANRIRTWLNCFCVDRAHATSFGKPTSTPSEDIVARSCRDWYNSSQNNLPFDIHLVAYAEILLIMGRFRAETCRRMSPGAVDKEGIIEKCIEYDGKLAQMMSFWVRRYTDDPKNNDRMCNYRGNNTQMIASYLRLVVLSTAFPYASKRGLLRGSPLVDESIEVACTAIKIMAEKLYRTGILRFAMEANFLYVSFCAAFLINLLRPRFLPLLDEATQVEIIAIVKRLINVLGSKEVAYDGRHSPVLYSRFLSSLLNKHDQRPSSPQYNDEGMEFVPQFKQDRQQTPPNAIYWPDMPAHNSAGPGIGPAETTYGHAEGAFYQQVGDADMDFSLQYFMTAMNAHGQQGTQGAEHPHMPLPLANYPGMEELGDGIYSSSPSVAMEDRLWPLDNLPQYRGS